MLLSIPNGLKQILSIFYILFFYREPFCLCLCGCNGTTNDTFKIHSSIKLIVRISIIFVCARYSYLLYVSNDSSPASCQSGIT